MPHPKARTWTLATLDRTRGYRLWFDPMSDRWEVAFADGDTAALTTRATTPDGPDAGPSVGRSRPRGVRPGRRRGDRGDSAA